MSKKRATIVIGPPRSGKTLNAKAIAFAYGCDAIVDRVEGKALVRMFQEEGGTHILILTNEPLPIRGRNVTIEAARRKCRKCGVDWIEPHR